MSLKSTMACVAAVVACAAAAVVGAPSAVAAPDPADANLVMAGIPIWVGKADATVGGECTLGWVPVGADGYGVAVTAAHCVKSGDVVRAMTSKIDIGGVTDIVHEGPEGGASGKDIALLRIRDLPAGTASSWLRAQEKDVPVLGVMSAADLNATRPMLCKVGARTGQTCGAMIGNADDEKGVKFVATGDEGDSGGPVFAVTKDGAYAVGVLSGGDDFGYTVATLLAPYLAKWNLTVGTPGVAGVSPASFGG